MELLAICDVETTGLDSHKDMLLEVAMIIVDARTLAIYDRFESVIFTHFANAYDKADDYVKGMHDKNGLWDDIEYKRNCRSMTDVDERLAIMIQKQSDNDRTTIRLCGASPRLDLNFIEANLPKTYESLSYRFVDITTIKHVLGLWTDVPELPWPDGASNHRAMADTRYVWEELKHYHDQLNLLAIGH